MIRSLLRESDAYISKGDVEELYLKLLNPLRDDELRRAIGKAARKFVVTEHNVNHIAARLADLMIKVAKS